MKISNSIQINDGHCSIIDGKNKKIIIDNVTYDIPKYIRCSNISQIDNHIYIDGYEFKNGKFKRTWKAFFHLFF